MIVIRSPRALKSKVQESIYGKADLSMAFLSRIIIGIDVVDATGTDILDLQNTTISSGPSIVWVLCRVDP
jgi:hypothetical protein